MAYAMQCDAMQCSVMWIAGLIAAFGTISYPSISGFVSNHAPPEQQGVAQGIITGIRGLCMGLGPLLFGFIFSLFHIDPMADTNGPVLQAVVIRPEYVYASSSAAALLVAGLGLLCVLKVVYGWMHAVLFLLLFSTTSYPLRSPLTRNSSFTVSPTARVVPVPLAPAGTVKEYSFQEAMLPGPPFAFGAALVFLALIVRYELVRSRVDLFSRRQ